MVNSQTIKEVIDAFKLDMNIDKIPSIIPVVEVNPKVVKNAEVAAASAINSTTGVILTANNNADIYILSASLSIIKDVTSTSTISAINITTEGGLSRDILRIASLSLTVQNQTVTISFTHPIKIKRNTAISITNGTNVANITAQGCISYFTDEVR